MFRTVVTLVSLLLAATRIHSLPIIEDVGTKSPLVANFDYSPVFTLAWPSEDVVASDALVYCRFVRDGEVIGQSSFPAVVDGVLAATGRCEGLKLGGSGKKALSFELSFSETFADSNVLEGSFRVIPGILTILPPLLTIILAITTQNVLVSLFCGIWAAAFFIHEYDPFTAYLRSIDTYILGAFADEGHIYVIMFDWFLSGLVGLMTRSGGAQGLADTIVKYAKTRKMTMFFCFLCGCAIFFDDYSNTLIVGSTFRPVFDLVLISREKLSFIVDATGAPICSLSPISSWIGYELNQIDEAFAGVTESGGDLSSYDTSAFVTFIKTIPGRYYPIGMIVLQIVLILTQRDFGPMLTAERRAIKEGKVVADDADQGQVAMSEKLEAKEGMPRHWINAVLPISLVVIIVTVGIICTGIVATQDDPDLSSSATNIFGSSDAYKALLWATLTVSIFTWIWLRAQYYVPFDLNRDENAGIMWFWKKVPGAVPVLKFYEAIETWIEGIKELMSTIMVLILAWSIGDVLKALGTDDFVSSGISGGVDKRAIPALTFILSALLSTAIGTSFGTMAIMFPTGVKTAYFADPGNQDLMLGTIASILTGSVFGDHVSPISDTTILSALSSRCDLMHHVRTQMPYALLVGFCSLVFGDLGSGYLYPMWAGLLLSTVALVVIALLISAPVYSEKMDFFNSPAFKRLTFSRKSKFTENSSEAKGDKVSDKSSTDEPAMQYHNQTHVMASNLTAVPHNDH